MDSAASKSKYSFPTNFIWGTSTAAYQIETAFDHDWKGVKSIDGHVFEETSAHERFFAEDAELIKGVGNAYRCSLDWSRLQRAPLAPFDEAVVNEYRSFLQNITKGNIRIMMVLHHFTNPTWFVKEGSWLTEKTQPLFLNYVKQMVEHFGNLVTWWNTFNEPGVYVTQAYLLGKFPPFHKSLLETIRVAKNLSKAHNSAYDIIKEKYPETQIGISKNTVVFAGETLLGKIPARIADWFFMEYMGDLFTKTDFTGLSYYARIPFRPFPVTEIENPGVLKQLGRRHCDMWEYYPEGLKENIIRYWKRYGKPIIITENGICTKDDKVRVQSIYDYLTLIHESIAEGVDVQGYFHWSVMDNFEWNLGPTYKFGLVEIDRSTMARKIKPSYHVYAEIARNNGF